ncbi:hypothetical protein A7A08_00726 [Methyloligella halotolerans]|uniref:Uncharacterized protein n=1 Tax=Methyloligella halotolerans TaxID=1177755 RepID=A0A1E2S3B1_9HYPH|nr:hypothetical protein A7A08_00726 [Methyloligella halotolerans]
MVGDDAVAGAVLPLGRLAGQVDGCLDQMTEQVDAVIVVGALKNSGNAFQAHSGVDGGTRQFLAAAVLLLVELHEDEVPDLHEPVTVLVGASRRAAGDGLAVVVEDLRARTARTHLPHGPEIVGGRDRDDLVVGEAGDLLPNRCRFGVLAIDGDEKLLGRKAEALGQQLPGERNRLFLEIIAEGKIPQHLEEGVVAGGIADIVEIVVLTAGADAFLGRHGARRQRLLLAGEDVLERHHPCVDEHQGWIVMGYERRRGHDAVIALAEILQEGGPDLVDAGAFAHG